MADQTFLQVDIQAFDAVVSENRLTIVFQPIIDVSRARIHGYEALVRGPEGSSMHSPLRLLSTAEACGRAVEFDLRCRRLAIEQFVERQLPGRLFLNVMPLTIIERDFREGLTLQYLAETGLAPERVVIELTEHVPINDYDAMRQATDHYRQMGFEVALDDLGAGHSSLRHWSELRPDYVKLDRHFVADIDQYPAKREFLRSIFNVTHDLSCTLIVEGVERHEELETLRGINHRLSLVQGFYFAPPSVTPPLSVDIPVSRPSLGASVTGTTAASITHWVEPTDSHTLVPAIVERFRADESLRCLPVVDSGNPVAIIRRHRFLALFTNPYSHSLYAKTPVHRIAEDNMVIGHIDEPLESLSRQLTESGLLEQEDFIITDAFGQYRGMGNILDLLREITALQVRLARHANPLTGLPGNVTIKETIEAWLLADTRFVVAYIDIDHFKPVNDEYGYACGDAVIRVLGQLLETRIAGSSAFAGHIGGDDFVIIAAPEQWQVISDDLFARFTDATEELAAWHAAVSRPTLSIAALEIASGAGLSEAQIAGELSVLKKRAKQRRGNSLLSEGISVT